MPSRAVTAAFIVSSVLAGGNAVAVKYSNEELDPLWGAALRFVLAALLLVVVMLILRRPMPRGRALAGSALFGLFNYAGAFAFAFLALVELEAGFAQIILAVVPLVTLLLAVAHGQERITLRAVGGAVVALVGIGIMSAAGFEGTPPVLPLLAALVSAICFGEAAVLVRRYQPIDSLTLNTVGMAVGALALLLVAVASGASLAAPRAAETQWAMAYMVVVGSVVVFLLYVYVLRHWDASRAAYAFVIVPPVTVAISAWLRNEPIGPGLLAGAVLVVAGVYLGALRVSADRRRAHDPPPPTREALHRKPNGEL